MSQLIKSNLSYPIAKGPIHGVPVQVAEGIFWLRVSLPFALNHINLWLLDKGDTWTIIDTGCSAKVTRAIWHKLLQQDFVDKPIDQIVVTHFHPDHAGLALFLENHFGCQTWMTTATRDSLAYLLTADTANPDKNIGMFYRQHAVDDPQPFVEFCSGHSYRMIVAGMPESINILEDNAVIRIGDQEWSTIVTGGHADGHMSLFCEQLNTLISGDQILPTITSNISLQANNAGANPLLEYLESFERFSGLPADVLVLPSHGKVFHGLEQRIMEIKLHHEKMLEKVMDICEQPVTAWESVPMLFRSGMDELNTILAFGETLAHLVYLVTDNQLSCHKEDDVIRFLQP